MKKCLICLSLLFSFLFIGSVKAYNYRGFEFDNDTLTTLFHQAFDGKTYHDINKNLANNNLIDINNYSYVYIQGYTTDKNVSERQIYFFDNISSPFFNNGNIYMLYREQTLPVLSIIVEDNYTISIKNALNSNVQIYLNEWTNSSINYKFYPGATNFDVIKNGNIILQKFFDYSPNPVSSYTVNFHINGGNVIDLSNPLVPNYINLDYQIETTTEELEEYLGDITIFKENYTFGGWYYDANLTQAYNSSDTLSSNINLYAKWIPNPEITFHLNEGYIRIYDSESSNNNSGTSGGGSSSGGGRHEDQLITEDFSIKLPIDKINDYIESLIVNKSSMIFEGWYYDKNFNNPYHIGDNITVDTHLYAKFRYERVEDFLNNTTFTEYTFDTNYGYAIITRGSNSGDIYLGLNTNNYDITVYAYNENLNTYSNEQGYCLTPIYSKDNKYYYLLNGDTTNYLNVLVLPKTTFENGNYNFLLTNNANITYTNNLEEVVIYDENGNQITTDLSNTYNIFENSMITDEKDLIGIFKRLINFKNNKIFENINTIWNKLKATDLYIYFMILIVGTLIIMIIKGARRN